MCKTVTLIAIFNHVMIQTYVEAQVIGEIEIDFVIAIYHQLVRPCSPSTSPPSLSVQLKSARPQSAIIKSRGWTFGLSSRPETAALCQAGTTSDRLI